MSNTHHRINVTVTDPHSEYVTQRNEKQQKFLRLPVSEKYPASDTAGATEYAKKHYRKIGYKVHKATHTGLVGSLKEAKLTESEELQESHWDVSFDHGPHQSSSVRVKAKSEEEAHKKAVIAAKKLGHQYPMINHAKEVSEISTNTLKSHSEKAEKKASKLAKQGENSSNLKTSYKKFRDATMTLASKARADKVVRHREFEDKIK